MYIIDIRTLNSYIQKLFIHTMLIENLVGISVLMPKAV